MRTLEPHLPALLLLLWSTWSGTFWGGTQAPAVLVGHLGLAAFAAVAGARVWDPLGLGRGGRVLLVGFLLAVGVSWLASPVPRAGRLVMSLLPAFLLVPAAVANCWSSAAARRTGLRSVAGVVVLVAAWALVEMATGGSERAALPLGHHNQLAVWLLAVLPLGALPWRDGGLGRWMACGAVVLGGSALLATRSLGAGLAVVILLALVAMGRMRLRWRLAFGLVAGLFVAFQAGRLMGILRGGDVSTWARLVYWRAGFEGILERPAFGWGPGSTAWTLGLHLRPEPGVNPSGEVVPDLHSLPVGLTYELGVVGMGMILLMLGGFVMRRWNEESVDRVLGWAAGLGCAAWALAASLSGLPAVGALLLASAVTLGAWMAAGRKEEGEASTGPAGLVTVALALSVSLLVLLPNMALGAYDEARRSETEAVALTQLERAIALDGSFPLYRARWAWLSGDAREALRAAEGAPGISALWLMAGVLGQKGGEPWSRRALVAACRTSPLEASAPFHLAVGEPREALSVQWAVRALLAEPRLLAAEGWRRRPGLLGDAVAQLVETEGVDAGWRLAVAETFAELGEPEGAVRGLAVALDRTAATSMTLHSFRRRPWPTHLAPIDLVSDALAQVDLVPAPEIPTTKGWLFDAEECGLGE